MQRAKATKKPKGDRVQKALVATPVVPMHLRRGRPPSIKKGIAQARYRTKRNFVRSWVKDEGKVKTVEQLNACFARTVKES